MPELSSAGMVETLARIPLGAINLEGDLHIPENATGIVLFAHGSGSSRLSPRNRYVAQVLQERGLATLLIDLLTAQEEEIDSWSRSYRFDIKLLAGRLEGATAWLQNTPATKSLRLGYFGASTGAAAALIAAGKHPDLVHAVVSRGGRPDLAEEMLPQVKAATLLIVGSKDVPVIGLNQQAYQLLGGERELVLVPGATHLFEEPGTLEEVARLAGQWFQRYLTV